MVYSILAKHSLVGIWTTATSLGNPRRSILKGDRWWELVGVGSRDLSNSSNEGQKHGAHKAFQEKRPPLHDKTFLIPWAVWKSGPASTNSIEREGGQEM